VFPQQPTDIDEKNPPLYYSLKLEDEEDDSIG
jgi:hypothetical protein